MLYYIPIHIQFAIDEELLESQILNFDDLLKNFIGSTLKW